MQLQLKLSNQCAWKHAILHWVAQPLKLHQNRSFNLWSWICMEAGDVKPEIGRQPQPCNSVISSTTHPLFHRSKRWVCPVDLEMFLCSIHLVLCHVHPRSFPKTRFGGIEKVCRNKLMVFWSFSQDLELPFALTFSLRVLNLYKLRTPFHSLECSTFLSSISNEGTSSHYLQL